MATVEMPAPPSVLVQMTGDPLTHDEWVRVRALFPYEVIARIASVPERIEVTSWRTAILSPEVAYQRLRAAIAIGDMFPTVDDALRWMLASNVHLSGLAPLQVLSAGDPDESFQRLVGAIAPRSTEPPPTSDARSRSNAA